MAPCLPWFISVSLHGPVGHVISLILGFSNGHENGFAAPRPETMVLANEYFGEACPASAPFFGFMGAAAALIFASEFSV